MLIIKEINTIAFLLLGDQKRFDGSEFRWSHFLLFREYKDNILLYNNLTKELISFKKSEYRANFLNYDEKTFEYLFKHYFIVKKDFNEQRIALQLRNFAKLIEEKNKKVTNAVILTTTGCNARCFYCFEAGVNPKAMTAETAEKVSEYLVEHASKDNLTFRWFGGEPLCNVSAIDKICKNLTGKIRFKSHIITNGFLFDEAIAQRAVDLWNLVFCQITLDGAHDTYNKVKNYVNPKCDPFDKVIYNIGLLLEKGVHVRIRLNLDFYNEKELYELVDFLSDKFGTNKNFSIYSNMIYEDVGYEITTRSEEENKNLLKRYLILQEYILSKNLSRRSLLSNNIVTHSCMVDSVNTVLISPEGLLGNCERHVDDGFYGSVYNNDDVKPLTEYHPYEEKCEYCPAFPSCIRLKICHPNYINCPQKYQETKLYSIKEEMISTFEQYLKKVNNDF